MLVVAVAVHVQLLKVLAVLVVVVKVDLQETTELLELQTPAVVVEAGLKALMQQVALAAQA
jgi:hypothetical protein